ncbi:MAG: Asp-tRNA(Asn)/Glu-tRNA(Gln) amidotransferase subunit GatC [Lachnospiraceae bacterium]
MNHSITDKTMEYIEILAQLELSAEEKEQGKKDMEEMLDYIEQLKELDTLKVEASSQIFPKVNVFREDIVINQQNPKEMLANAPSVQNGSCKVPKTIG